MTFCLFCANMSAIFSFIKHLNIVYMPRNRGKIPQHIVARWRTSGALATIDYIPVVNSKNLYRKLINESSNKNHPERRIGEVFISNVGRGEGVGCIGWKTARIGNYAYLTNGHNYPQSVPIFAQISEIAASDYPEALESLSPKISVFSLDNYYHDENLVDLIAQDLKLDEMKALEVEDFLIKVKDDLQHTFLLKWNGIRCPRGADVYSNIIGHTQDNLVKDQSGEKVGYYKRLIDCQGPNKENVMLIYID